MKNRRGITLYFVYSFLFIILFYSCYLYWFNKENKSFIWQADDLNQGYAAFLYMGRYIRTIFSNVMSGSRPFIPVWDTTIGMGSDVHITLGTNFFDIFQWVSAFVSVENSELAFNICLILKIYLAGLSFILYSYKRFKSISSSLVGGIIYTFSASLYISYIHFDFINPFYIFPLVMLGAEKVWNKEGNTLFVFSICYAFLNHFYFAYMMSIMVAIYVIVKYIVEGERGYRAFFALFLRYLINAIIGIGMAAFAFLPIVINISNTDRLDIDYGVGLHFSKLYYLNSISGFVDLYNTGKDAFLGFACIVIPMLGIVFVTKNKSIATDKIMFIILSVVWGCPALCSVMNGFSYPNQRWIFGYVFIVAVLASQGVLFFYKMKRSQCFGVILLTLSPVFLYLCMSGKLPDLHSKFVNGILVSLIICVILILIREMEIKWNYFCIIIIVMTCLTSFRSAYVTYSNRISFYSLLEEQIEKGTAYDMLYNTGASDLERNLEGVGKRVDSVQSRIPNGSWATNHKLSSFDFYEPYYNNDVNRFLSELGITSSTNCVSYDNINGRTILEILLGANYYICPTWYKNGISCIYNEKLAEIQKESTYELYSGEDIDIVHYFNQAVSEENVEQFCSYELENIMSKAVILDKKTDDNVDVCDINSGYEEWNVEAELKNGLYKNGKKYYVSNDFGYIDYKGLDISDSSVNVCVHNLRMGEDIYDYYTLTVKCLYNNEVVATRYIASRTPNTHMYGNKHDWCVSFAVNQNVDEIQLFFDKSGEYMVDNIEIYSQKTEKLYDRCVGIESPEHQINSYGTYTDIDLKADEDGYLFLSIPYSVGWHAKVDGVDTDVIKADYGFMAIKTLEGNHNIQIRYCTPGLKQGICISIISFVLFLFINSFLEMVYLNRE